MEITLDYDARYMQKRCGAHLRLPDLLQSGGGQSSDSVKLFLSSEERYLSYIFSKYSTLFFFLLVVQKLEISLPRYENR